MLGFLGFVTPEKVAQGAGWGDEYLPGGTAISALESNPFLVGATLTLLAGLELLRLIQTPADAYPGDAGFDPLGLKPEDPEAFDQMVTRELQNGRLAMLGFAGCVAQELVNAKPILVNLQDNDFVSF